MTPTQDRAAVIEPITGLLAHLDTADPGGVVGLYLYGSAVDGLQRDSDIDLLLVTLRSLTDTERERLVAVLMAQSGWSGHAGRFPEVAHRRPIELTSVVIGRMSTDPALAHRDLQFGEWLRAEILDGTSLRPTDDPDVVLLIASALSRHVILRGPVLTDVLPIVPFAHARDAALRVIPGAIQHAPGDERNALLTLARILVTVDTGTIVSKAAAAAKIIPSLPQPDRRLMERALSGYLHGNDGDWTSEASQVRDVLGRLELRARRAVRPLTS